MRIAAVVLAVAVLSAVGASAAAAAGWGRPFRLAEPQTTDITPAQIAFSTGGEAAVSFGTQDEDDPAISHAFVTLWSPREGVSAARRVPGAQQVLDLAFEGTTLKLLTGKAGGGRACCDSVALTGLAGGGFGRPRTLVSGLTSATLGSLAASPTGLLAAIATVRGVWASHSGSGGRLSAARRLNAPAQMPWTLAATSLPRGQTTVAWTATTGQPGEIGPSRIFVAQGNPPGARPGAHPAVALGEGHQIDQLELAPGRGSMTMAWIESWFDHSGSYHSEAVVSDLGRSRERPFPIPGQLASGLTIAGNANGDQVIAWKACDGTMCAVYAAVRRASGRFTSPTPLGAVDAYQNPAAAISARGLALVGWIKGGHVLAAARSSGANRFAPTRLVSDTSYASDLALDYGPGRRALAAWTQGSFAPDVVGEVYSSP